MVTPQGARLWRIHYRYGGKQQTLSLGRYPDVPLKLARERRTDVRKLLADGIDPSAKRKSERAMPADSFEAVAKELLAILRKSSLSGELPPSAAGEVVEALYNLIESARPGGGSLSVPRPSIRWNGGLRLMCFHTSVRAMSSC